MSEVKSDEKVYGQREEIIVLWVDVYQKPKIWLKQHPHVFSAAIGHMNGIAKKDGTNFMALQVCQSKSQSLRNVI